MIKCAINRSMQQKKYFIQFIFDAVFILVSFLLVFIVSRNGAGCSSDDVVYLGVAYNLLHTHQLTVPFGIWFNAPLTHFPPLFTILIAIFSAISGGSVDMGARILNAFLFSCNILVIIITLRRLRLPQWVPYVAAGVFLTSISYMSSHAAAASEPAMLLFGQIALLAAYEYSIQRRKIILWVCVVFLWFVTLIRYAGVTYLLAIGIYLVIIVDSKIKIRWLNVGAMIASAMPIVLWTAWTITSNGRIADRVLTYHHISLVRFQEAFFAISLWINRSDIIPLGGIVLLVCSAVYVLYMLIVAKRKKYNNQVLNLFGLFSVVYVVFLLLCLWFVDAAINLDDRILLPLQEIAVICFFAILPKILKIRKLYYCRFICMIMGAAYLLPFILWYRNYWVNGVGYASSKWNKSTLFTNIHQIPPSSVIYSNVPQMIFFQDSRGAYELPWKYSLTSLQVNPDFKQQFADMMINIANNRGYIVYFRGVSGRRLPQEEEIRSYPGVYIAKDIPEGVIFGLR